MKYIIFRHELPDAIISIIGVQDKELFTSFPAEVGNPNYDAFLEQAKLTDKQVKALTPDTWYDFPEGE